MRYGIAWRAMPHDRPRWAVVYQQSQHWLAAGCFETLARDVRAVLRMPAGREADPTAAIIDSRALRTTSDSGPRAGHDGAKRKRRSKLHMAAGGYQTSGKIPQFAVLQGWRNQPS